MISMTLDKFTKLMDKNCDSLLAKNISSSYNDYKRQTKSNKQPWFHYDCHKARKTYYDGLNRFSGQTTADNRRNLVNARTNFKMIFLKKHFAYKKKKKKKKLTG